jgi:hypothetical protein
LERVCRFNAFDFALDLANYVEMDKPTAKLREYIREKKKAYHSNAMRSTNLNSKQMDLAVLTLINREEIVNRIEKRTENGREYQRGYYEWTGE